MWALTVIGTEHICGLTAIAGLAYLLGIWSGWKHGYETGYEAGWEAREAHRGGEQD